MTTVSFFGLGYVGLPSAAVFADNGVKVIGVDVNQHAVDTINSGQAHIVEPGLDDLLSKVVSNGQLRATTIAEKSDVYVIAVPTPFNEGYSPNLDYVQSATNMIAPLLEQGNLIILESTSPVGATEKVAGWIQDARPDLKVPTLDGEQADIFISYCPERILPGKVIEEVVANDRVIGGITPACSQQAVNFYKNAVKGECHITNSRTAELCKLSENSFRDVNIAFANELSIVSSKLGVDVHELIGLANRHPRVNILQPGTGVGGHCIAVDPWFIIDSAPEETKIIRAAREVNDYKPKWVVEQVQKLISGDKKPVIGCFGLAYKPDVDDLRESPSVDVVKQLEALDLGEIVICEPFVDKLPEFVSKLNVRHATTENAVAQCDVILFLTAHGQFKDISQSDLDSKIVFDACGLLV